MLSIPSELDELNSNFNATMAKLLVTTENSTLYNGIFSYYLRGHNYLDVNDSVSVENFVNVRFYLGTIKGFELYVCNSFFQINTFKNHSMNH